ncbi:MAG: HDOD domain-containing protein [Planctomycetota bacterium]
MQAFIARQPIFNTKAEVCAYELLFRDGLRNAFPVGMDPDLASSRVIADSLFLIGLEEMAVGKPAFINVTKDLLLADYVTMLPPDRVVIEVLETVEPTPDVIAACRRLKGGGYRIALDDFVYDPAYEPLLELADVVKVDFRATPPDELALLAQRAARHGAATLAEKVETGAEFETAVAKGYTFFQGYFFSKPVVVAHNAVPEFKLHYLELLRELNRGELDLDRLDDLIKRELSLSYKLLRYVNSPLFGLSNDVESIRHAMIVLGDRPLRRWISFVAVSCMGEDKPQELMVMALVRAKFCEELAKSTGLGNRGEELFLMGMFSLLDAIIDRPLIELLDDLPIGDAIKSALCQERNRFRDILDLVIAYERGAWADVERLSDGLTDDAPRAYVDAISWAHESFSD